MITSIEGRLSAITLLRIIISAAGVVLCIGLQYYDLYTESSLVIQVVAGAFISVGWTVSACLSRWPNA